MSKMYRMVDLGIESLAGRKVKQATINQDKDLVVLDTDKGPLYLTWEGDCCSKCFIADVSGSENLVNATILSAENAEWKDVSRDEDAFEVIESMGTKIKTDKGYVTLGTRLEHNGYYRGQILISDDEPIDQYRSPRDPEGGPMSPLCDF